MTTPSIDELVAVEPTTVTTYLRSKGWQQTGTYAKTTVYSLDEADVLVPWSAELRDYPARMNDLLRKLAAVENRPAPDILRELRSPLLDVQHIRTMPDTPSGTTPLDEGFKAVRGLRDLYAEAARSALAVELPTETTVRVKSRQANEFLGRVRLAAPADGSFVFRIETPLDTADTEPAPQRAITPRSVLLHLYRAVRAAHGAAAESSRIGTPLPFERGINDGVSAKLCAALSDIGGSSHSPFEFRFGWSWSAPVPEATQALSFNRLQVQFLGDGARHLKRLTETRQADVRGHSVRLDRAPQQRGGRVTLIANVTTEDRVIENQRVVLRVHAYDYDRLLRAHGESAVIEAIGEIKLVGQHWEMDDPELL